MRLSQKNLSHCNHSSQSSCDTFLNLALHQRHRVLSWSKSSKASPSFSGRTWRPRQPGVKSIVITTRHVQICLVSISHGLPSSILKRS